MRAGDSTDTDQCAAIRAAGEVGISRAGGLPRRAGLAQVLAVNLVKSGEDPEDPSAARLAMDPQWHGSGSRRLVREIQAHANPRRWVRGVASLAWDRRMRTGMGVLNTSVGAVVAMPGLPAVIHSADCATTA